MTRILFFGTHPKQFNGYSKVVYEIVKCMSLSKDYTFTVYGFQNFYENPNHRKDLPDNVFIYDAFANEAPKSAGFGVGQIKEFVKLHKPDVCVVYNDMLVITQCINQLKAAQAEGVNLKIIAYIDQVYLYQKKEFIDFVNKNADAAILFTKSWEECIQKQGLTLPAYHLEHGFNKMTYYPIPRNVARQYFGIKPNDFVILNLNRNQPRKRWDICLKAFAEIVSRHVEDPIKLVIATAVQGAWNLLEIFERELKKRDLTLEVGMKHLIILDNPQKITDEETNILYNIADIGINTCDGEGFGLCNFEQAGIGIPQIVPRLGGFVDFFDDSCAMLMDPKMAYYVDNTRDMVCGEALLCDYIDFVDAVESYYSNKELREKHGTIARRRILEDYKWERISNKLCEIVDKVLGKEELKKPVDVSTSSPVEDLPKKDATELDIKELPTAAATVAPESAALIQEIEKIDTDDLKNLVSGRKKIEVVEEADSDHEEKEGKEKQLETVEKSEKSKKKSKKSKKTKKPSPEQLKKLAKLLVAFGEDSSDSDSEDSD